MDPFRRTAVILALIYLSSLAVHGGQNQYFLKYSWVVAYGAGENELGIEAGEESPRVGPCAFSVHAGIIYILDAANSAVKMFSIEKGDMEGSVPLQRAYDDIMVDAQGGLYLLDSSTLGLLRIGPDHEKSFLPLPARIALQPSVLTRSEGEVLVRIEERETYCPKTGNYSAGMFVRPGESLKVKYLDQNSGVVEVLGPDGLPERSIALRRPQLASIDLLGEDGRGCRYLQLEHMAAENKVGLEVVKLSQKGDIVAVLPIPENDYFVWTSRLLFVDESGRIYQVLPQRERVKINVWAAEGDGH